MTTEGAATSRALRGFEASIDAATTVGEWFQISLGGSANGSSVFRTGLSAEVLPEFEYSSWRPRGFATLGVSVGSGDNDTTVGLGFTFLKEFRIVSLSLSPELHVAAAQHTSISDVAAGAGGAVALGASRALGSSLGTWTPRIDFTYRHLASRDVTTVGIPRQTDPVNDLRLGAGLSFAPADHVALSLSLGAQIYSSVLAAADLERRVAFAVRITEGR